MFIQIRVATINQFNSIQLIDCFLKINSIINYDKLDQFNSIQLIDDFLKINSIINYDKLDQFNSIQLIDFFDKSIQLSIMIN